ncbi:XRE family transcriptional regulator [Phytohabitans sp. ZYX-F-186]|uniref:XRE family transcriptional regulator n=1 Tax=Phytohabitans maris TaxID=3071409 RepID=A0ABU0ZEQ9_9ACTN|nr:XRE family transcriptional regulator [Phytohabitans sp. ZYX-F-186]MDQ7905518.1 XRE family transcriptional regulator [Phytohabitans sp. ZYX-F-186]
MTDTVAALTAAVAGHVRALRTARGWSLDELAGRSGVSKGMVVQIEAARTNPSVGTLVRIADAFGVTIARLLEPAEERTVRISDAESAPQLWRGGEGGYGRLLRGMNDPSFVELWEWRLAPGERHTSENHMPGTREVLHILDGTLTLTVDGTDHTVTAGQTIDFLADRPHSYRNDASQDTRLVMVAIVPNTEWDRRSESGGPRA